MEFKFRYRFEAAHRFLNSSSEPCMTPHGHTWHATLHLNSKTSQLDEHNMVLEFSKTKKDWKKLIGEVFDHSYMCNYKDPLIEVLLGCSPGARLLRFPGDPTTEIIALFLFHKAQLMMQDSQIQNHLVIHGITIEETPTNSIFCDRAFYLEVIEKYSPFDGWWNRREIDDRSFQVVKTPAN